MSFELNARDVSEVLPIRTWDCPVAEIWDVRRSLAGEIGDVLENRFISPGSTSAIQRSTMPGLAATATTALSGRPVGHETLFN
jgi:hypothetical protein